MQNYSNLKQQPTMIRETIPTNSNKQENRYFFLSMFAVVIIAAILLGLAEHKQSEPERLPNQLSNLATQLSIASDEIVMMQEVGLIGPEPTVAELQDNELAPFTTETVILASTNCFVIEKPLATLRLVKWPKQPWHVQWRAMDEQPIHHDSDQQDHSLEHCQSDNSWLAAAHLAD